MDLSDGEREFLTAMQAVKIDADGVEVYVGLTAEESGEFLALTRVDEAPGKLDEAAAARLLELRRKHEAERQHYAEREKSLYPKPA